MNENCKFIIVLLLHKHDFLIGPCVYSPAVATCPHSALFHKPNLERVVNIRSRDHLFRYYNIIGINFVIVTIMTRI